MRIRRGNELRNEMEKGQRRRKQDWGRATFQGVQTQSAPQRHLCREAFKRKSGVSTDLLITRV